MGEWSNAPLGELVQNLDSRRVPLSSRERDKRRGPFPYYGATGVMDHVDDFLFEGLHLLVAEDGSVETAAGKPFLQLVDGQFWVNNHAHVLKGASDDDTRFLYYALSTVPIRPYMSGSVQAKLSQGNLNKVPVPYPTLASDRHAIAHILGTLDGKIKLNRRMSETLEEMAGALFKSWFVDFDPVRAKAEGRDTGLPKEISDLFPDSFEESELGEIPKGWGVGSIYEVADVIYGAPFASAQFNTAGIGEPLIRIRDLADESPEVSTPEVHPKGYKVRPGSIVVGMDGEFRAYLWGGDEAWLNQRVCVFKPKAGWSSAFVRNAIAGPLAHVEATETATTVIHLGKADIDRFKAVTPSQPVAGVFSDLCQPWYDRIVGAKQESRTLAALRDALLPKLISGELRVDAVRLAQP